MEPKTSDEALAQIKEAAAAGRMRFADDTVNATLDDEIQQIFVAIRMAVAGQPPKRPLWTADGTSLSAVLPLDDDGHVTPEGHEAVARASVDLGIPLSSKDLWRDAALRLREKSSTKS